MWFGFHREAARICRWANRAAYPPLADSGRPAMNPCLDGWRVMFIRAEMKGYMGGAFL